MEFNVVQQPAHPPAKCLLCGAANTGPFVDTMIDEFMVGTADGLVSFEGRGYICIGNADFPGCLPAMIIATGGVPAWVWEAEQQRVQVVLANADTAVGAAHGKVARLRETLDETDHLSDSDALAALRERIGKPSGPAAPFGDATAEA